MQDPHTEPASQSSLNASPTLLSTQTRIYTSFYCSLGFLMLFASASLYFMYSDMGRSLAAHTFLLQVCASGVLLCLLCAYLTRQEATWLWGHRVLIAGLLILECALQLHDGMGIRCPSVPASLLVLCYVGQARGRTALLQMFVLFECMYIGLFVLEWWNFIPGVSPNKEHLPITLFLYCTLAGAAVLCMLARYKEES